jgi:hypothetical protein
MKEKPTKIFPISHNSDVLKTNLPYGNNDMVLVIAIINESDQIFILPEKLKYNDWMKCLEIVLKEQKIKEEKRVKEEEIQKMKEKEEEEIRLKEKRIKEEEEERLKNEFNLKYQSKETQTIDTILNDEKYRSTVREISSMNLHLGIIKECITNAKEENLFIKSKISNLTKYVTKVQEEEKERNETIQKKVSYNLKIK